MNTSQRTNPPRTAAEPPAAAQRLSLTARWQRFWYLQQVEMWLDPMPRRKRKQVIEELKANLHLAANEVGMSAAISDHGKPRALAAQYLADEPQGRPTWYQGVFAVSVAIVLWLYACTIYVLGSVNTLLSAGTPGPVRIGFLGIDIEVEATDDMLGATFSDISWGSLVAFVVIFLLTSRIWRLWRRPEQAH